MGICSSEFAADGVQSPRPISEKELDSKFGQIPFFKLAIVGESKCGKTSITNMIAGKRRPLASKPTLHPITHNFEYNLNNDSMKIGITISEIPENTDLRSKETYYQDLDGALVVVDISNKDSVRQCRALKRTILTKATQSESVGLKSNSSPQRNIPRNQKNSKKTPAQISPESTGLTTDEEESSDEGIDIKVSGVNDNVNFPLALIGSKFDLIVENSEEALRNFQSTAKKHGFHHCVAISPKMPGSFLKLKQTVDNFFHSLVQRRAHQHLKKNLRANPASGLPVMTPQTQKYFADKEDKAVHDSIARADSASSSAALSPRVEEDSYIAVRTPRNRPTSIQHQFFLTGLTEHDVFLLQTEPKLARVYEIKIRYEKSKVSFSDICFDCGIVKALGTPIVHCMTSFRDQVITQAKISVEPRESLFEIKLSGPVKPMYKKVLEIFHTQFMNVCKEVNRELPLISQVFISAEEQLNKESKNANTLALMGTKTREEVTDLQKTLEKNQELLLSAQDMTRETLSDMRNVMNSIRKIFSDHNDTPR